MLDDEVTYSMGIEREKKRTKMEFHRVLNLSLWTRKLREKMGWERSGREEKREHRVDEGEYIREYSFSSL